MTDKIYPPLQEETKDGRTGVYVNSPDMAPLKRATEIYCQLVEEFGTRQAADAIVKILLDVSSAAKAAHSIQNFDEHYKKWHGSSN